MNRLAPIDLEIMCVLLSRKAHKEAISLTSVELGEIIGYSQQSTNRNLIELDEDGIVERTKGKIHRPLIKLTEKGVKMLKDLADEIYKGLA